MPNQTLYDNFSQVRQYIDENNTSYVSKTELANASYVTSTDLSNYLLSPTVSGYEGQMKLYNDNFFEVTSSGGLRVRSFTYNQLNSWGAYTLINRDSLRNYVNGRIAEIESTYATTSQLPVIDENIIPKENNTYTLGDNSYMYNSTYTNNIKAAADGLTIKLGNYNRFKFSSTSFYPVYSSTTNIGGSSAPWNSTYTNNLYLGNSNIKDLINGMFSYDSTTGTLTITTLS